MPDNTITARFELKGGETIDAMINKAERFEKTITRATKAEMSPAMARADSKDYGTARGIVGTGAESRDFAKQSQGLGGLVRVYATFAANIFAVTAAFNALSRAADTANMIQGLDQLGASTGRNLGSISKRLVEVTDNAISMRDAMQATAQATSGGMSAKNIERLGQVAKVTSQALGLNMTDALSRLSRGITKIEPELLDELGIFVRVDKAARDYALSIGKSATQLTDFERRQAFANAVLAQAEEKFGSIKLDSSPYDKLQATFNNVTQAGLMLLNKVLGPIVNTLASSPVALGTGLVAIAGTLIKQALPAITAWKTQIHEAAIESSRLADENLQAYKNFQGASLQNDTSKIAMNYKAAATEAANYASSIQKLGDATKGRKLAKAAGSITEQTELPTLQATKVLASQRLLDLEKQQKTATTEKLVLIKQEQADVAKLKLEVDNLISSQQRLNAAQAEYNKGSKFGGGYLGQEAVLQRIAKGAERRATQLQIIDTAVDNTRSAGVITGFANAYGQISKAISDDKLSKVGGVFTGLRAGAAIATTAIGGLVSSLSVLFGWVSVIGVALAVLDTVFSKNTKQADEYSKSLDALKGSVDGVDRTLELISKKTPLERLSIDSISATSNALEDLADSTTNLVDKFIKVRDSANWWDNLKDKTLGFFTSFNLYGSQTNDLAQSLSDSINAFLKSAGTIPEYESRRKKIQDILGSSDFSKKGILASGRSIEDLKAIPKLQEDTAAASKKATAELNDFKAALDNANKSQQAYITSLSINDPLFKFGSDLIKLARSFDKLTDSTDQSIAAIIELLKNPDQLSLFGGKIGVTLASQANEFEVATTKIKQYSDALTEAYKNQKPSLLSPGFDTNARAQTAQTYGVTIAPSMREARLEATPGFQSSQAGAFQRFDKALMAAQDMQAKVVQNITEGMQNALKTGAKFIEAALGNAALKAQGIVDKALSVNLTGRRAAQAEYDQAVIDAKIQQSQITIAKDQLIEQRKIRAAVEINALYAKKAQLPADATERDRDNLQTQINTAENIFRYLKASPEEQRKFILGATQDQGAMQSTIAAAAEVQQVRNAVSALEANSKVIKAGVDAAAIKVRQVTTIEAAADLKTTVADQGKVNSLISERAGLIRDLLGPENESSLIEKAKLNYANLENKQLQEQIELEGKLKVLREDLATSEKIRQPGPARVGGTKGPAMPDSVIPENKQPGYLKAEIAKKEEELTRLNRQQGAEKLLETTKRLKPELDYELKLLGQSQNKRAEIAEDAKRIRDAELDAIAVRYAKDKELGKFSEDEITLRDRLVERTKIVRDSEDEVNKLLRERLDIEEALATKRSKYTGARARELLANGGMLDPMQAQQQATEEFNKNQDPAEKARLDRLNERIGLENTLVDIRLKSLDSLELESQRFKTYSDAFTKAVDGMADAFVDFAMTGKSSFEDLIKSMILGLIKYEMQAQLSQSWKAFRGTDTFTNFLSNTFGIGKSPTSTSTPVPASIPQAKGGVWDAGVQKFAMGGTFTNSIVNQPTLFKFAKGTGLMGEAGPEAIMPLSRDKNGKLGVSGSSSNTQVIVNNYTTAQAETKETVDSRGNRKIEVTIGDLVSSEIQRYGSSTQQSLKSTFGGQPQLIRR